MWFFSKGLKVEGGSGKEGNTQRGVEMDGFRSLCLLLVYGGKDDLQHGKWQARENEHHFPLVNMRKKNEGSGWYEGGPLSIGGRKAKGKLIT